MKKINVVNEILFNRFANWRIKIILMPIFFITVLFGGQLSLARETEQWVSLMQFTFLLDERIPALMSEYGIPGVNIALIKNGEVVWRKAYGYADLEQGIKMTTDTRCRVESISKSLTAWGIMKLVEQGKIELDKPLSLYLKKWRFPQSKYSSEKLTIRQLLSHSAGLSLGTIGVRYTPQEEIPSLEESLTKDVLLQNEPGVSFSYSNTGFNLLELLIEEVTGLDFSEYMAAEVLIPLGMRRASYVWSAEWYPPVPKGYDLRGNAIPVYVYPDKASGGLFATVDDIAAFITAGMPKYSPHGGKVLSARSIDRLYTPEVEIPGLYGFAFDAYGLGHFIENLSNEVKAVSHGGQGSGWMTHFHSVPQTGDGIVILTNSQRSWPFMALILNDWAKWCGFSPPGMYRIIRIRKVLLVFIGMILFTALWKMLLLGHGLITGKRRFSPLSGKYGILRIAEGITAVSLTAVLIWSENQDYLFIASLFPIASGWLGWSALILATVLMLSALLPYVTIPPAPSLMHQGSGEVNGLITFDRELSKIINKKS